VGTCAGGVEVLEKILKKFGKGGTRNMDVDGSGDYVHVQEGALSIDGWGVYLGMGQEDGARHVLPEDLHTVTLKNPEQGHH